MTPSAAPGPLVLLYHGVDPCDGRYAHALAAERAYVLKRRDFVVHLDAIAAAGRHVVDPAEWLARGCRLDAGEVLLTFDDGARSDYDIVLPLLLERRWRALFFVTTGPVGERGRATWEEWRKMAGSGMTVGSHGVTHRFLPGLRPEALETELRDSRDALASQTGAAVWGLSCPGGRCNRAVLAAAERLGYRAVFTSAPDDARSVGGLTVVGRVAVSAFWEGTRMQRFLANQRADLRRMRRRQAVRAMAQRVLGDRLYEFAHGVWTGYQDGCDNDSTTGD